ncbi:MAG TPA: gamma-glutamyltransferase [Opitutaceae bacterium]|nr:gamma-glutamyltransferase [Opitutaceae bacterium]
MDLTPLRLLRLLAPALAAAVLAQAVPVPVEPVAARGGVVVAGHPEAVAIGVEVLRAGGNAVDAAVAVSFALGVAEPYASGPGGKIMLLHFDAAAGRTYAVDGMDEAAASVDPAEFRALPADARRYGWKSVCVPGLPAALELAHRRWGTRPWAELVRPSADLAAAGFTVLPKTRDLFAEREERLRADPELARLYLPGGRLPEAGAKLANPDLARTLRAVAAEGAAAFYEGETAQAIAAAARPGGGYVTAADFARYRARLAAPLEADWRGMRLAGGPPPTSGCALVLPVLLALESGEPREEFRTAGNLAAFARVWREVQPHVQRVVADAPGAREAAEALLAPEFVRGVRERAAAPIATQAAGLAAGFSADAELESVHASTTHFVVVDAAGNVVSATQSLSLHFGAGVVAPGTGVVLNDSMSNFGTFDPAHPNFVAPGRRPRSTISPMILSRGGRAVLALGVPGAQRIPTAVAQVLLDRFARGRPLAEAIGDTRVHLVSPLGPDDPDNIFEVEASLPSETEQALVAAGWQVRRIEPAGRGRHFGGVNAVERNADGTWTGFADPRRTNVAAGP